MKNIFSQLSLAAALTALGCQGSASDPKTLDRSDLNSPGTVETVTGDKSIQVRFPTGNFEKDFQGYYVFASTKSLAALTALVKYPSGADATTAGIPRCADNSAFFEAFGLAAATNDCKGATNAGDVTSTSKLASPTGIYGDSFATLAATPTTTTTTTTTTEEKMSNYQACSEAESGAAISLPVTAVDGTISSKGTQKCTISKAYDKDSATSVAMANSTSYVVMVMTVAGSKYNKVSWSSNIVSDTPAPVAYSGSVTLTARNTFKYFTINTAMDTATLSSTTGTCPASDLCSIGGTNSENTDGIYIGREATAGSYPQRLFISTPDDSSIRLLPRGPQTYDPEDPAVSSARIPSDQAIKHTSTSSPYAAIGSVLTVYEDHVFDFVITTGTSTYNYGKIVFGDVSYATATDTTSAATIPVTIIIQGKAATQDYFTSF